MLRLLLVTPSMLLSKASCCSVLLLLLGMQLTNNHFAGTSGPWPILPSPGDGRTGQGLLFPIQQRQSSLWFGVHVVPFFDFTYISNNLVGRISQRNFIQTNEVLSQIVFFSRTSGLTMAFRTCDFKGFVPLPSPIQEEELGTIMLRHHSVTDLVNPTW